MTQLEDRLRDALLHAPATQPTIADPLIDLDHRVARARTRWATAAAAALAVLVAAIVVPLSLAGGGHGAARPAHPVVPAPVTWSGHRVQSMTVGSDGAVWTLSTDRLDNPHYLLERHARGSSAVAATYQVPAWAEFITSAAGEIWVWGGGNPGFPSGYIDAVNPATGHQVIKDLGPGNAILPDRYGGHPVLEHDGALLGLGADRKHLRSYRLTASGIVVRVASLSNDTTQLQSVNGAVGLFNPSNSGAQYDFLPVGDPGPRLGGVPMASGLTGIWTTTDIGLVEENPDTGASLGPMISTYVPKGVMNTARYPVFAVGDSVGGLYVGLGDRRNAHAAAYLDYYSPKALAAKYPKPTATAYENSSRISDVYPDGRGVVYLTGDSSQGAVAQWDATAAPAPKPTGSPASVRPVLWSDHQVLSETISTDGSVWTLSTNRRNNPTFYVERHEPSAGEVVAKYRVPGWARSIASNAGLVWVWGGGDGGYPDGYVEAIDQSNGHHVIRDLGKGKAILPDEYVGHPVTPIATGLFAVLADRKSLVEIGLQPTDRITVVPLTTAPDTLQVFSLGEFGYASNATQNLRVVALTTEGRARRKKPVLLSGPPLTATPHGVIVDQQSAVTEEQSSERYLGTKVKAPAANGADTVPVMAVLDRSGGLYVGWAATPDHAAQVLTYYTHANLTADRITSTDTSSGTVHETEPGRPDATVRADISELALDIAGGVVYLQGGSNSSGTIARWDPATRP